MIKVIDDDNEYSLAKWSRQLMIQDIENPKDYCEVSERDFSEFEHSVYKFLKEMEHGN
jgi:hypothetical protein